MQFTLEVLVFFTHTSVAVWCKLAMLAVDSTSWFIGLVLLMTGWDAAWRLEMSTTRGLAAILYSSCKAFTTQLVRETHSELMKCRTGFEISFCHDLLRQGCKVHLKGKINTKKNLKI